MQGRKENILTSTDKISAFKEKSLFWSNKVQGGCYAMFEKFCSLEKCSDVSPLIIEHLEMLERNVEKYFPDISLTTSEWVRNPFSPASSSNLSLIEEEELIDIRNDRNLKDLFERYTIENFWIKVAKDYPSVARKAFIILLQFSTSYLCELGFSVLTNIKCKKRERLLSVEAELRVALCDFPVNIQKLCEKHQAQTSH